jgi:hypothetical protein
MTKISDADRSRLLASKAEHDRRMATDPEYAEEFAFYCNNRGYPLPAAAEGLKGRDLEAFLEGAISVYEEVFGRVGSAPVSPCELEGETEPPKDDVPPRKN